MSNNLKSHVKYIQNKFKDDFLNLDKLILSKDLSQVPIINAISSYIVSSGGKRIRPLLNIIIAKSLGYKGFNHIRLSACIELIHTATLLHDDIVDNSAKRRGKYTSHKIWSNSASILTGDFLFTKAFEIMTEIGDIEILKILSNASSTIVEGEMLQLISKCNINLKLDEILTIINSKTAVLFSASAETAAMVASNNQNIHKQASKLGLNFGMLFQIIDDILDYLIENQNIDKNTGDDFAEGKITLPLVYLMQLATKEEKSKVISYLKQANNNKLDNKDSKLKEVYTLLLKYNCLIKAKELAISYADKTIEIINDIINHKEYKKDLIKLIKLNIERLN